MKLTKQRLREIIKEELNEQTSGLPPETGPGEEYDPYPAHWYSIGRKELLAFVDGLKSQVGDDRASELLRELGEALERIMVKFPEELPFRPPPRD